MDMLTSKEYFEPCCEWRSGKESDAIDIELYGFDMQDVKVTLKKVDDEGNSTISIIAESPRRIQKKIDIPKDYDVDKIRAVFCSGNLSLELPKKAAPNKLEISKQKFEIIKILQESAEDMQKKIFSAAKNSYPKLKVAAVGSLFLASMLFAYKCYTECYGVESIA
ncbi:uncharacterized protein LOC111295764 [Durio zibethinus]|uniref:Uncharacterized protein LOC111295764 n=1 Tax=Durio zibethinus TaxID=66656 RepID=A0A6P5YYN1_DURZI|nr:uncharacterized protein LOC111295764 [Durio zibethinus]